MTKMNIGVQLYTLRKYLKSPENVPEVLQRVKALGVKVVQVSGVCKMEAAALKRIVDDNGLSVCITHVPFDRLKNDLPALVEEHKVLECNEIGIGMMPAEFRKNKFEKLPYFCDFLNDTAEKLSQHGMSMNYHNHNFEFKNFGGERVFDYLIKNTDGRVKFIPDTFWIREAGVCPEEYIQKLTGRINTVHLKDYASFGRLGIMKAVGEGTLDFKKILSEAEAAGAENAVVELDFSKAPYDALRRSLDYIGKIY